MARRKSKRVRRNPKASGSNMSRNIGIGLVVAAGAAGLYFLLRPSAAEARPLESGTTIVTPDGTTLTASTTPDGTTTVKTIAPDGATTVKTITPDGTTTITPAPPTPVEQRPRPTPLPAHPRPTTTTKPVMSRDLQILATSGETGSKAFYALSALYSMDPRAGAPTADGVRKLMLGQGISSSAAAAAVRLGIGNTTPLLGAIQTWISGRNMRLPYSVPQEVWSRVVAVVKPHFGGADNVSYRMPT